MENLRPFDFLNSAKSKNILIELKNNKQLTGQLISFDLHINLVIDNLSEIVDGKMTRKLGQSFVRGDTILWISVSK